MKKYFLYYAGYNNLTLKEQIGVAVSKNLKEWEYIGSEPQVPLLSQGASDHSQTSNPCVLKHEDKFKMWYQGKSKEGFLSICYSESDDGINWKSYEKPVLAPSLSSEPIFREGYQHPHVIFDEKRNIFKMWCIVYKKGLTSIGFCESVNGLVWTSIVITSLSSEQEYHKYFYPFVMKDLNTYKMWFTERINNKWMVSYATSTDGILWNTYEKNPIISPFSNKILIIVFEIIARFFERYLEYPIYGIGSPFVWKNENKYFLIAHEVGPRGKLYIPLYESKDGISWNKKINNILPKPNSEWNNFFQADPFLYVE